MGGYGSGGNASDGGAVEEALLVRPPLTSCSEAHFLIGHGPVPVHGLGVVDPSS